MIFVYWWNPIFVFTSIIKNIIYFWHTFIEQLRSKINQLIKYWVPKLFRYTNGWTEIKILTKNIYKTKNLHCIYKIRIVFSLNSSLFFESSQWKSWCYLMPYEQQRCKIILTLGFLYIYNVNLYYAKHNN